MTEKKWKRFLCMFNHSFMFLWPEFRGELPELLWNGEGNDRFDGVRTRAQAAWTGWSTDLLGDVKFPRARQKDAEDRAGGGAAVAAEEGSWKQKKKDTKGSSNLPEASALTGQ